MFLGLGFMFPSPLLTAKVAKVTEGSLSVKVVTTMVAVATIVFAINIGYKIGA